VVEFKSMSSFKAFLLGGAAVLVGTAAIAADLPSRRYAAPYVAVPTFTWTGFYAGVNAGAAINNSTTSNVSYGPAFGSLLDSTTSSYRSGRSEVGFTGGGQAGYNYQFGAIVTGIETDINYADIKSNRSGSSALTARGIGSEALSGRTSTDYFGTVRGRIGFLPMDRLMVFGTGGLAYGNVDTSASAAFATVAPTGRATLYDGSHSSTQVGYTVGGGVEYALTDNITVKGEYLYVDLGRNSATATGVAGPVVLNDNFTARNNSEFSVARAGLNWKFNGF
jgi:outer membrane immunogenic protein